jgi:hypothetical protein
MTKDYLKRLLARLRVVTLAIYVGVSNSGAILVVRPDAKKPLVACCPRKGSDYVHRIAHMVIDVGGKMCSDSAKMKAVEAAYGDVRP